MIHVLKCLRSDFILVYCLVIFSAFQNTLRYSLSMCFKTSLESKIGTALEKHLLFHFQELF